ncbi:hypothetical protein N9L68_02330, partial [bacterium]|nr:hypothetical protein [bacterium]
TVSVKLEVGGVYGLAPGSCPTLRPRPIWPTLTLADEPRLYMVLCQGVLDTQLPAPRWDRNNGC